MEFAPIGGYGHGLGCFGPRPVQLAEPGVKVPLPFELLSLWQPVLIE